MDTQYHLLVRPLPKLGESTLGYCLRLGNSNGHAGLAWLRALAKKIRIANWGTGKSLLEQVTGHTAVTLATLYGPSPAFLRNRHNWHQGLKTTYWNASHRRWCPDCLAAEGFWKAEWTLALQVACSAHSRMLLDTCPACSQLIPWDKGSLFHCKCGYDLRSSPRAPTDENLRTVAALLSKAFAESISPGSLADQSIEGWPLLSQLHLPQLCELLWFFGAYTFHRAATKPQKIPGHGQLKVVLPFLRMAIHILQDWPWSFQKFLIEYTKPANGESASLKFYLGDMYLALLRLLRHPDLHFLHEEFERFAHEKWQETLVRGEIFEQAHPLMSGANAASHLGISLRQLEKLIVDGTICGRKVTSPHHRNQIMVERASVELFQKSSGSLLTLREAANLLRITIVRLRLLIKHNLLQPITVELSNGFERHMHLSQKAVYALLASLNQGQNAPCASCDSMISVYKIWKWWLRGDDAFIALIRALRSGELKAIGRDPAEYGIRAILIERIQFKLWYFNYRASQNQKSIPEAARALHIDEDLLYLLAKLKLIKSKPHSCDTAGRAVLGIDNFEIEQFHQRYIWGQELAKLAGKPYQTAGRHLMEAGLKPICRPEYGKAGIYLFLREEIDDHLNKTSQSP